MTGNFSAGPQALGYLHQARYALRLMLDAPDELQMVFEGLDDIVFESEGNPHELLQIKHHSNPASLTNSSPELWKTIRIWSFNIMNVNVEPATALTLITSAVAPTDSIAARLRPDRNRDEEIALSNLIEIAEQSENIALNQAFMTFLNLNTEQRKTLVNSIHILDGSGDIAQTADKIKSMIKFATNVKYLDGLFERLEGWWFGKLVAHLRNHSNEPITTLEVHNKIRSIAEQFREDSLPIDFLEAKPERVDPEGDDRIFVQQLKAIAVNNRRIEKAIIDYYRAFEQRSRWVREDLLIDDELKMYENKLIDEWERFNDSQRDENMNTLSETELKIFGTKIYNWVDQHADYKIRPHVTEPYIVRGSYHMLADQNPPRVWWHPQFIKQLTRLLNGR
jgi:hypothetical protein